MFKSLMLLWLLLTATITHSQSFVNATTDTVIICKPKTGNLKFNYKQLIIPGVLIGYGTYALESGQLKSFNRQLQKEVTEDIDNKLTIDDFSQYVPMASVFALHALGVKSKNTYKDQALIMATSYLILSTTVFSLKSLTHEMRPDGTTANSFPSGHTANAFAGAEFMWQEYKDESVWYGISGYLIATGTGAFRVYNNRHWLSDVAAGAGIGILSTKIAYWVSPFLKDKLFGQKDSNVSTSMMPFYNGSQVGVGMVVQF
ncbi:PA-phosphatase [Flavobacterium rivuli WB 3.3-2 = DSM 21788]|uniref:PA-phosphatase n=1 Tax=Flavobacterium rivuli WB 3.3-2 = DSM 21788 TaxID=1121895 RepID=A0A0A2M1P0_9FLAO|nr:phosphatase PAP2 family protein [Flavobacterium rivuli]KGO86149.1 PA-phosphatase [Flavobacterium rivuli WB 3.3-2 = DSM 21788]